jgi:hypothetical protein
VDKSPSLSPCFLLFEWREQEKGFLSLCTRQIFVPKPQPCVTVFFTSLIYSTILTKSIGLTNSCRRYGIVPACAGVCRAYLIVHLKCTRKSSKMLCEGISSIFLLPAIPNHNLLSYISFFLPYCSSVLFFLSVTLSLVNSCAHCSDVERIQLLPHQTYQ